MSSPAPATPTLDQVRNSGALLQVGHRGAPVATVQLLLGVFDDGGFGQNTRNAVVAFQQREAVQLAPDEEGKIGAATLAALENENAASLASLAKIDKRNKKVKLHPLFRRKLGLLAEALAARGMNALMTDGFRTFAEQDILFAKGRTTPGPKVTGVRGGFSNHNYGLATDMYPVVDGQVFTEKPAGPKGVRFAQTQQAIIDEAEALGLFSGVHFSFVDTPHVQSFPESRFSATKCHQIFVANGNDYDAVWREATRIFEAD
jgi:peptidoglycan hydrolase-like protein with peptidoglycan-binding domain